MPIYEITDKTGKSVRIESDKDLSQQQLTKARVELQRRGTLAVDRTLSQYALETLKNTPESAKTLLMDTVNMVTNPVQTVEGLAGIVLGAGQSLAKQVGVDAGDEYTAYSGALVQHYKDRYGSVQAVQDSFREDPLGVVAEAMAIVAPAASATKVVASSAGKAKLAQLSGKVAAGSATVSQYLDPISVGVEGARFVSDKGAKLRNATSRELFNFDKIYDFPQQQVHHGGRKGTKADIFKEIVLREEINPTPDGLRKLNAAIDELGARQKEIIASRKGQFITLKEVLAPIDQQLIALKRMDVRELDRAEKIRELTELKRRIEGYFEEAKYDPDWEQFATGGPFEMVMTGTKQGRVLDLSDANSLKQALDDEAFSGKQVLGQPAAARSVSEFGADAAMSVANVVRGKITDTVPMLADVNSRLSDLKVIQEDIEAASRRAARTSSGQRAIFIGAGGTAGMLAGRMLGVDPITLGGMAAGGVGGAAGFGAGGALMSPRVAGPIARRAEAAAETIPRTDTPFAGSGIYAARAVTAPVQRELTKVGQEEEGTFNSRIVQRIDQLMEELLGP